VSDTYVLRGLVRCGVCKRKMAGEMVRKNAYYRCAARMLAPGPLRLPIIRSQSTSART
jgi:hypothetical protein